MEVMEEHLEKASKTLRTMLDYLGLEAVVKAEARDGRVALSASSEDSGRIIGRKGQSLESLQTLVNRMMQKADQEFPRVYIDVDGYNRPSPVGRREFRGRDGDEGDGDAERGERREFRGRDSEENDADRGDRGGRREFRGGEADGDSYDRPPRRDFDEDRESVLRQQALDAAKEVKRWGDQATLPPMTAAERRIVHLALSEDTEINTESRGDGARKSIVISLKAKE